MKGLRAELGPVLREDFATGVLMCEGGDLIRDCDLEPGQVVKDKGCRWRAGPRAWSRYAADTGDVTPIAYTTWRQVAEVLATTPSNIRRRRRESGDTRELPFRSVNEIREWWRNLVAPPKKSRGGRKTHDGLTLDQIRSQRASKR